MLRILSFVLLVSTVFFIESCGYKSNEGNKKTETLTEDTKIESDDVGSIEIKSDEIPVRDSSNQTGENVSDRTKVDQKSLFDDRLSEAIENAKKGGVNPNFIVELVITEGKQAHVVEALNKLGIEIMSKKNDTINIVSNPNGLEKIKRIQGIDRINLITENYYPNR